MDPKVAVVIDSTTTMPPGLLEDLPLRTAPAIIIWEGEQLRDGIDIQPDEFYRRLAASKESPTTSQASPAVFRELFSDLLAKGHDVLAVTLSSKLSGMYASAVQAKEELKSARIEVIDSLSGTMTIGLALAKMRDAAMAGAGLQKCKEMVEKSLKNTGALLTVETLEYLRRGGRIGNAQKFLGSLLQLKPILEVVNGGFEGVEKVRTRAKSLSRLVDLTIERIGDRRPVYIAAMHANAQDVAESLIAMISDKIDVAKTYVCAVSPGAGVHLGPGTVGLAYLAGE